MRAGADLSPTMPTLHWQVRGLMAARGFESVSALHRALQARFGSTIAMSQFAAMLADMPARLNTEVLAQLCAVLECDVGDLLSIENTQSDEVLPVLRGRPPRKRQAS